MSGLIKGHAYICSNCNEYSVFGFKAREDDKIFHCADCVISECVISESSNIFTPKYYIHQMLVEDGSRISVATANVGPGQFQCAIYGHTMGDVYELYTGDKEHTEQFHETAIEEYRKAKPGVKIIDITRLNKLELVSCTNCGLVHGDKGCE